MTGPHPKDWIAEIAPYVPGRSSGGAGQRVAKLSSNENSLGTSPAAREAFAAAAASLDRYPEPSAEKVRQAVAARYDLDPPA